MNATTIENPVVLCDECTCGVANDDWSHLDMHNPRDAEEAMTTIKASLELYGRLTRAGDADMPGYFGCPLCGETQCGGGHLHSAAHAA